MQEPGVRPEPPLELSVQVRKAPEGQTQLQVLGKVWSGRYVISLGRDVKRRLAEFWQMVAIRGGGSVLHEVE